MEYLMEYSRNMCVYIYIYILYLYSDGIYWEAIRCVWTWGLHPHDCSVFFLLDLDSEIHYLLDGFGPEKKKQWVTDL